MALPLADPSNIIAQTQKIPLLYPITNPDTFAQPDDIIIISHPLSSRTSSHRGVAAGLLSHLPTNQNFIILSSRLSSHRGEAAGLVPTNENFFPSVSHHAPPPPPPPPPTTPSNHIKRLQALLMSSFSPPSARVH